MIFSGFRVLGLSVLLALTPVAAKAQMVDYVKAQETVAYLQQQNIRNALVFIDAQSVPGLPAEEIPGWFKERYAFHIDKSRGNLDYLVQRLYRRNDGKYVFGPTDPGNHSIALAPGMGLFVDVTDKMFPGMHLSKLLVLQPDGAIVDVVIPAGNMLKALQSSGLRWRFGAFDFQGVKVGLWRIEADSEGLRDLFRSIAGNGDRLTGTPLFQLIDEDKSRDLADVKKDRGKLHDMMLFTKGVSDGSQTDARLTGKRYRELAAKLSSFMAKYGEKFGSKDWMADLKELDRTFKLDGVSFIRKAMHQAASNKIDLELRNQERAYGNNTDYSAATYAVGANDLDKLKKLIRDGQDINPAYKNWTALNQAAQDGNLEAVRLLVGARAYTDVRTAKGTPLLTAIDNGHEAVAMELIMAGADINARVKGTMATPLIAAVRKGLPDLVKLLLSRGANPFDETVAGDTAWDWAVSIGSKNMIQLFKDDNARGGRVAFEAIEGGSLENFNQALDKTLNPYQVDPENEQVSLIAAAAGAGRRDIVLFLLDRLSVDANFAGRDGASPLFMAAKNNREEMVELLIDRGADLQTHTYYAPLHTAAYRGNFVILYKLLNAGADPLLKAKRGGGTPLHSAAEGFQAPSFDVLLNQPAYLNRTEPLLDDKGETPLITLLKTGKRAAFMVDMLLGHEWMDLTARDQSGKTAYDYAREADFTAVLDRLKP